MTSPAPHRARHARAEAPEYTEPASAPIDMPTQRIATVIPSVPVMPSAPAIPAARQPAMAVPATPPGQQGHGGWVPGVSAFPPGPYGGLPIPPAGLPVGHPPIGRDRTVPVIVTVMLVFAVVGLIALVSLIDGAGSGTGGTGGTGVGVPSASSTAEQIGAWADGGGMSRTRAISDDLRAIGDAASRYDTADLNSACRSLEDDIASARSYDPVPDAQVQASWSSALTHGANAATYCIVGTTSMDSDLIAESASELGEMNDDLGDVATRMDAITGS